MDLLTEVESMVINVTEADTISKIDLERWQKLFNITRPQAFAALEKYRRDLSRKRISDEHWDAVQVEKQVEGHDRDSYEYSLTRPQKRQPSWNHDERGTLSFKWPVPSARLD